MHIHLKLCMQTVSRVCIYQLPQNMLQEFHTIDWKRVQLWTQVTSTATRQTFLSVIVPPGVHNLLIQCVKYPITPSQTVAATVLAPTRHQRD